MEDKEYTVPTYNRLLEECFVQKWQKCSPNFAQKKHQQEEQKIVEYQFFLQVPYMA